MAIPIPVAGQPITDDWGVAITARANQLIPLVMAADFTTNSTSLADVTGLTFPVVSGKAYVIDLIGTYLMAHATSAPDLSFNHPGGTCIGYWQIAANGDTTFENARQSSTNAGSAFTNSGTTTTARIWRFQGRYLCTSSGTFAVRAARDGTSGGLTIHRGSGGLVVESA